MITFDKSTNHLIKAYLLFVSTYLCYIYTYVLSICDIYNPIFGRYLRLQNNVYHLKEYLSKVYLYIWYLLFLVNILHMKL